MNLLILSPGRRVEIVQYFKDAFHKENRKVYTLDMSNKAPALYFGDEYFRIDKDFAHLELYINKVLEICKKKEVGKTQLPPWNTTNFKSVAYLLL